MAKQGYRVGQHQQQVWVSLALRLQMKALAAANRQSLQEFMLEAFREKVDRHGTSTRSVSRRSPEADFRRSGPTDDSGGDDSVGVGASHGGQPVVVDWDALMEVGKAAKTTTETIPVSIDDSWVDPAQDIA